MDGRALDRLVVEPLLDRRQGLREVSVGDADNGPALGLRSELAAGKPLLERDTSQRIRDLDSQRLLLGGHAILHRGNARI